MCGGREREVQGSRIWQCIEVPMWHCVPGLESLQRAEEATGKSAASGAMGTPGYRRCQDHGMSTKDNKRTKNEWSQHQPLRQGVCTSGGRAGEVGCWTLSYSILSYTAICWFCFDLIVNMRILSFGEVYNLIFILQGPTIKRFWVFKKSLDF